MTLTQEVKDAVERAYNTVVEQHPDNNEPSETSPDYNRGWATACDIMQQEVEKELAALSCLPVSLEEEVKSGWISVDEALPESNMEVLIAFKGHYVMTAFYRDGFFHDENESMQYASHWMPLPSPPNQP